MLKAPLLAALLGLAAAAPGWAFADDAGATLWHFDTGG